MPRSPVFVALLATVAPAQSLLHVPATYPTIAAALAAARAGDTIAVAPGTYIENLVWPGTQGIRLVATGGPSVTTIDGGGNGRVVEFSSRTPVTATTVVEGFTIRGGLLNTTRNYGAGILLDASNSPTIRGNVIRDNVGDGPNWNYGGGIYVGGGSARIEHNVIEANVLRNGSWNYGAGIYLTQTAQVSIVGNVVRANQCDLGSRGYGGGIFVDLDAGAVIASNAVTDNVLSSGSWNYGAGIRLYGGGSAARTLELVNNTIASNVIRGGNWQYGGGAYLDGPSVRFFNNIVAGNSAAGVYVNASSATVTADFNCYWANGVANVGLAAAPNDLNRDPGMVSATDWHLAPASPCVDAGSNADLPVGISADPDLDPRRSDGDLDGLAGNGTRVDIGADERCLTRLALGAPLTLGGVASLDTDATAGWIAAAMMAPGRGALLLDPYGTWLLDPNFALLALGPVPMQVPIAVPPVGALVGLEVHFQSLAIPLGVPQRLGALSRRVSATIW